MKDVHYINVVHYSSKSVKINKYSTMLGILQFIRMQGRIVVDAECACSFYFIRGKVCRHVAIVLPLEFDEAYVMCAIFSVKF